MKKLIICLIISAIIGGIIGRMIYLKARFHPETLAYTALISMAIIPLLFIAIYKIWSKK